MANLGAVRHDPLSCEANLDLSDGGEAADELRSMESRAPGMTVIVDCTPIGCGRDAAALLALALGCRRVRVIASTGFPSERLGMPGWVRTATEEEIAELMLRELREGIDLQAAGASPGVPAVRAGAITAAVSTSVTTLERKLLRAAALASRRSLAPIFVQLPAFEKVASEIVVHVLDELEAGGASPSRVCIVLAGLALASAVRSPTALDSLLVRKAHVCIAGLGMPDVWLPPGVNGSGAPVQLPHDGDVATWVHQLLAAGHSSQLLLSTGVRLRLQRERFGGGGYGHCRTFFVPLLRATGVSEDAVRDMTARNAARLLCWWQPPPPPGRTMIQWTCSWCKVTYDGPLHEHDRLPEDQPYFEKLDFRYCSIGCLAKHRETSFKPVHP